MIPKNGIWIGRLCALLAVTACAPTTSATCINVQTMTERLSALNASVRVDACEISRRNHRVTVELLRHGEVVQRLEVQAEGSAYQLSLDTEVDLDFDGVRDLGVSTGKGRAGDGMRYFRIDSKKARLTDVGEAPRLERSTAGRRVLWALVPGSGDVQSTRMEYELVDDALRKSRAIQFIPLDGAYRLTVVGYRDGGPVPDVQGQTVQVPEVSAQACMSGGACPVD